MYCNISPSAYMIFSQWFSISETFDDSQVIALKRLLSNEYTSIRKEKST